MVDFRKVFGLPGVIFSAAFALFGFIIFYTDSGEALKSLVAASFVFFLTWLSYTVVRWIYEMF